MTHFGGLKVICQRADCAHALPLVYEANYRFTFPGFRRRLLRDSNSGKARMSVEER